MCNHFYLEQKCNSSWASSVLHNLYVRPCGPSCLSTFLSITHEWSNHNTKHRVCQNVTSANLLVTPCLTGVYLPSAKLTTEGHQNLGLLPVGSLYPCWEAFVWGKDQSSGVSSLNPNACWPLTSCVSIGRGLFSIYELRKILAPIRLIRKDKIFPVVDLMHKKHQITGSHHHHHHRH